MKQPLAQVALLYIAGIVLGDRFPLPLEALFAISFALIPLAWLWERARRFALAALLLFAGWTNITCRTAVISPHDLRVIVADQTELVKVRGRLAEAPRERLRESPDGKRYRTLATLEATALCRHGEWEAVFGRIHVTTPGELPAHFFSGQTAEVTGVLSAPPVAMAPGLFDYRAYLARLEIYYQLKTESTDDWQLAAGGLGPARAPLPDRFNQWARATLARGLPAEDEPVDLQRAMALGWRTPMTEEVARPFLHSGTVYLFAISGLHVVLISGMLLAVLRSCLVPRVYCGLIIIPLLWFYTAASGWPASAIRATTMMTVVIGGWSLGRPANLINSLFTAGFLILLWDPQELFQASFQLSFFVVLALGLFLPATQKLAASLLKPDPLLPAELRPRWRRWLDAVVRFLAGHLAVSISCWLGSVALTAYYFHLFTPVTLLLSPVAVLLAALSLSASLGSMVCGAWFPAASILFNHAGWFIMTMLIKVCTWAASLPHAWMSVPAPGAWQIFFYYAALLAIFGGCLLTTLKKKASVFCGVAILGVGLFQWQFNPHAEKLTVLAVNGGDAIVYESTKPADHLLIDCGTETAANYIVTPYLHSRGLDRLPHLLLTHGDIRHIGGSETITTEFHVEQTITSPASSRSGPYRQVMASLQTHPDRWRKLSRGDRVGVWEILHPASTDHFAQSDDNALVLRANVQGTRVLLLSDLGQLGQRALLDREQDLRADIVVTGLPVKGEPLQSSLLEAIKPRTIIVSCADVPVQESARKELRRRLAQLNIPVLYTSDTRSVIITFTAKGWNLETGHSP